MTRDNLYALPLHRVGDFEFDEAVAKVFPDMIGRSVPGYASILAFIGQLGSRYAQPDTNLYDLGCSLGAATMALVARIPADCTVFAIDNSAAMISRLEERIQSLDAEDRAKVRAQQADIIDIPMENASLTILNFTLQFVPALERANLLQRIYDSLVPGGALLLSEKICFEDLKQQEILVDLHHDFKRAHGYSDLEIAQKRTAIENRLIPETMAAHINRLHEVGFRFASPWFQCFNFASFLAVK